MKKKLVWRSMVVLCTVLFLQLILLTHGFAYCVHRDTGAIEIPPGNDTWVEECCDGRPSHWPASAMPIPVFIYSATPVEFQQDIIDAVQTWNDIESSWFEMVYVGTIAAKSAIPGAIVMGFDPDHCADDNDCGIAGTGCKAESVNSSWDGYQIQYCTIWADANAHDWNAPGAPNSLMVMTHELGHVLGIMHPGDNPHGPGGQGCGPEFNGATMACCGGQIDAATLELDDMAAATSLYPQWKYTVQVFDSSNNPIGGAAVWMEGTCLPHEGVNRHEGGMVFGDIPFCLTGESEASDTYYPNITYLTGPDGKTGEFRVMHDEFCFTVVADGFHDSYGCLTLPAPGNYITPVVLDRPPVCDANGPYTAECQGDTTTLTLDGTGSSDPDPGDILAYSWTTACSGGSFDNMYSPTPMLTLDSTTGSVVCDGSLTVSDTAGAVDSCSSTVTVFDTLPPSISCPPDTTIECDESTDPSNTGMAIATDVCTAVPIISSADSITPGSCPEASMITRTWTATDTSGNSSSCVQTIEIVDTTPPDIQCNAPATITPPDAPISFTATSTDNCSADPSVEIIGYDCFKFTKKGKRIDKTESCIVEVNGDIVTIVDSGGVDDNITWTVRSNDNCGNVSESTCSVLIVLPEKP